MEQENKQFIEYASAIVGIALDEQYDTNTVLNGLAIATAAMLIDTTIEDDSYTVDSLALYTKIEQYIETLSKAVEFAKGQLEVARLASEAALE